VPPPPGGLAAGRERFLQEAAHLRGAAGQPVPIAVRWQRLWVRPAFRLASLALAAVFALSAFGGGLVGLAEASLPGDWLYPVKLAMEDLRLSLISDPANGVEQNLSFAAERVDEMRGLAEQGSTIPDAVVDRMSEQIDQAMHQTTAAPPEEAPVLMEQFRQSMQLRQEELVRIREEAGPEGDQPSVNTALRVTERAYELVDAAKGDPKRFQEEWLHQIQPETPPAGQPSEPFKHQNDRQERNPSGKEDESPSQSQSQQPEPAEPSKDVQATPEADPSGAARPRSSQSGRSAIPRPSVTPSLTTERY
jgi:hypothetical protein